MHADEGGGHLLNRALESGPMDKTGRGGEIEFGAGIHFQAMYQTGVGAGGIFDVNSAAHGEHDTGRSAGGMVQNGCVQIAVDGEALSTRTSRIRWGPSCCPRSETAACLAFSTVPALTMPPERARPPVGTCALTMAGPSSDAMRAASSGRVVTVPDGVRMPAVRSNAFALCSRRFNAGHPNRLLRRDVDAIEHVTGARDRWIPDPASPTDRNRVHSVSAERWRLGN